MSDQDPKADQPPALVPQPPPWVDANKRRDFLAALRQGSVEGILAAFCGPGAQVDRGTERMAEYILELRRQNVAVLGQSDVFVRRTEKGELLQVIQPVTLSLDDGTLYQIPDRWDKVLRSDPSTLWVYRDHKKMPYKLVPVLDRPEVASVSHEGFLRMNAVAGCSVVNAPVVNVDGRSHPNPYIERNEDGDVTRVVIATAVAGPSPTTGNVVLVQYVLDLDPRADLLHMLSNILKGKRWKNRDRENDQTEDQSSDADMEADATGSKEAVFLVARSEYLDWRAELPPGVRRRWHWIRLYSGIGFAHDLGDHAVRAAYDKHIGITENLLKKAQTVARRNAMKAHPALSRHTVNVGKNRFATVPVVGWTGAGGDLDRYARALDAVARGERLQEIEVIEQGSTYDPVADLTGDAELDPVADLPTDERAADTDTEARNRLLAQLDELVGATNFSTSDVEAIGYPPPETASAADLAAMLDTARKRLNR